MLDKDGKAKYLYLDQSVSPISVTKTFTKAAVEDCWQPQTVSKLSWREQEFRIFSSHIGKK